MTTQLKQSTSEGSFTLIEESDHDHYTVDDIVNLVENSTSVHFSQNIVEFLLNEIPTQVGGYNPHYKVEIQN